MDESAFLGSLIDMYLCYGEKSPDMELFEFGFGREFNNNVRSGDHKKESTHILHALCRLKVIWLNEEKCVECYDEDTSNEFFRSHVECIIGYKIKRVNLSDKNDLWFDFGDFWMVFATWENGEESWRLFIDNSTMPHLVASDTWLEFDNQ